MTGRTATRVATLSLAALAVFCWSCLPTIAADVLLNGGLEDSAGPAGWNLTQTLTVAPTGDYNSNGVVDAADYVAWRNDPATFGGSPGGYDTWRANFGSTGGGGGAANAVEHLDFANQPAAAEGQLGLYIRPFAGNYGVNEGLNGKVSVVLQQTYPFGPSAAGRTYTFTGYSYFQLAASNNIDTLFEDSPSGAVPSPTQTYFELAFLNASDQVLGTPTRLDLPKNRAADTLPDAWQQHTLAALAPAGTTKIRVKAAAIDMVASCTTVCPAGQDVYFDNFTLRDGNVPSLERLTNGNLDTPGAPTAWTLVKSAQDNVQFSTADYARHSGNVGMWLRSFNGGDAQIEQTVAGVAGQQYQFSGWSKWETGYSGADPFSTTQSFMKVEFLDGSNAVIGSPVNLDLRTVQINDGTWRQLTAPTATAPVGTAKVRVSAGATGMANSGINPQSAMLDDFALIQVGAGTGNLLADFAIPEPATMGLLLVAVFGWFGIRYRS